MPPAQFYNWCEVQAKMWIMNLGKPVSVPQLNEQMAIELGANLIGETLIFVMAAGILFMEYSRQARKERGKEESRRDEIQRLNMILEDLYFQSEKQDAQIRELMRSVNELQGNVIHKPWVGRPPKSPPPPPPSQMPTHQPRELIPVPEIDVDKKSEPKNPGSTLDKIVISNKIGHSGIIMKALDYFEFEVDPDFITTVVKVNSIRHKCRPPVHLLREKLELCNKDGAHATVVHLSPFESGRL
ncbi:hypothetical protein L9F63_011868, partial [Diploptera punctata]